MKNKPLLLLLNHIPLILFLIVLIGFGSQSEKFLTLENMKNILVQSSALAVVATGITLVLLTGGVDLSVGSLMFLAVAVAGKLIYQGSSLALGFALALLTGAFLGSINGLFIARLRLVPFIVTLAMLFVARGLGLWFTQTRAMNMPEIITHIGSSNFMGLPVPFWIMAMVVISVHLMLTRTPFGLQIYAIGQDPEAAAKAGIKSKHILMGVYILCGFFAALSGLLSLSQTGAVSPSFGLQKEFSAIAASVLGGASLFGGRGHVLPGTLLGAVLIQTVENGMVILNVNPYVYNLVTSTIIFIAVLLDALRTRLINHLTRRKIRPLDPPEHRSLVSPTP